MMPLKKIILTAGMWAGYGLFPSWAMEDWTQVLESGQIGLAEKALSESKGGEGEKLYLEALVQFYLGDWDASKKILDQAREDWPGPAEGLKNYVRSVQPILDRMETFESENFVVRASGRDRILAREALDGLENARRELGKDLELLPKGRIRVEIYPTLDDFSLASTLSRETLERSGAIGICKFGRLMILSPEQLAYGYRWRDTLAHEYVHFLINALSGARCPLWLHEGIAKYFETRWRLKEPGPLTPGNRTELARAFKESRLIPFSRMEPSMVYLKDQEEVRLAFSEVASAVGALCRWKGVPSIPRALREMAAGKSRKESFQTVFGFADEEFERRWREDLRGEDLAESPGAAVDRWQFGPAHGELEDWTGLGIRGHLRLGDRLRQNRQLEAALLQYRRALDEEPSHPVALVKLARTLIALGRPSEAGGSLDLCVRENPNYVSGHLLRAQLEMKEKKWEKALSDLNEAKDINPFHPEVRSALAEVYEGLGETSKAEREKDVLRKILETER